MTKNLPTDLWLGVSWGSDRRVSQTCLGARPSPFHPKKWNFPKEKRTIPVAANIKIRLIALQK
jgi:hypothetical protein